MDKKKIVSLALALTLSLGTFTACSFDTGAEVVEETIPVVSAEVKNFERYEEMPSSRTYEPYEHIFFIRYNNYWDLKGGTIEIPDGYELLDIKYYNEKTGYGSQSNYTDIWLVNTDTVVVEPVFNSRTNTYDYSQPGSLLLEKDESEKKVK